MKRRSLAALLTSAALFAGGTASAQEILAFGTANVEQHPVVTRILGPWAEAVNADAGDLFQIELRNGPMIVSHNNYYDRLQNDVVQIVWGITAFDPGRFPRAVLARNSGCDVARTVGAEVDRGEADALAFVRGQGERRFHTLDQGALADLIARVGGTVEDEFVARTPDGAEVLAAYRQALADASGN